MQICDLMPRILESPEQLVPDDLYANLPEVSRDSDFYLKLEGYNPAGSIKLKAAIYMLDELEAEGLLHTGCTVVESSSGNLGVALSMCCAARKYSFLCVGDPMMSPVHRRLIEAYGGSVVCVNEKDDRGGYLGSRIARVKQLLADDSSRVWPNQYCNYANPKAHSHLTARAIASSFPGLTSVYIGASTCGTLLGVSRYLRSCMPGIRVVAVDVIGSSLFGGAPGPRTLPGLGASQEFGFGRESSVNAVVRVPERACKAVCRYLSRRRGWLVGPSTGAVVAAAVLFPDSSQPQRGLGIGVSADLGERYLDNVFAVEAEAAGQTLSEVCHGFVADAEFKAIT